METIDGCTIRHPPARAGRSTIKSTHVVIVDHSRNGSTVGNVQYVALDDIHCSCSGAVIHHTTPRATNNSGRGWVNLGLNSSLSSPLEDALQAVSSIARYSTGLRVEVVPATEKLMNAPWFQEYCHKVLSQSSIELRVKNTDRHYYMLLRNEEYTVKAPTAFCLRGCCRHGSQTAVFHLAEFSIARDLREQKIGWLVGPCMTRHWIRNMHAKMKAPDASSYTLVKACGDLLVSQLYRDTHSGAGTAELILESLDRTLLCPLNADINSYTADPQNDIHFLGFIVGLKYAAFIVNILDLMVENTKQARAISTFGRASDAAIKVATGTASTALDATGVPLSGGITTTLEGVAIIGKICAERFLDKVDAKYDRLQENIINIVNEFNDVTGRGISSGVIPGMSRKATDRERVIYRSVACNTLAVILADTSVAIKNVVKTREKIYAPAGNAPPDGPLSQLSPALDTITQLM